MKYSETSEKVLLDSPECPTGKVYETYQVL